MFSFPLELRLENLRLTNPPEKAESVPLQPLPTPAELKAHIPPEGTTIGVLFKIFKGAVVGKERRDKFASMIRTVSRYEKETRSVYPI